MHLILSEMSGLPTDLWPTVEPQLRHIAEVMYYKYGLMAADVQYGLTAEGAVQLYDLNFLRPKNAQELGDIVGSQTPIDFSLSNMVFLGAFGGR